MTRLAWLAACLAALALTWSARTWPGAADRAAAGGAYFDLDDSESSLRLRLVELCLVSDSAPREDGFTTAGAPSAVPWPPLVHATLALGARLVLPRDEGSPELGGYSEHDLRALLFAAGPWLGLLAALALATAAMVAVGEARRRTAFVVVLALSSAWPLSLARESLGTLHAHPWVVALLAAELAALAVALRASERIDTTLGALVCGACAGLAHVAGPEAWPVSAAILGVFVALAMRAPRTAKRDGWRSVLLYVAACLALCSISDPGSAAEFWLPDFSHAPRGLLSCSPATLFAVALTTSVALHAAWCSRRDPLRTALLAAALPALLCALFDRRFFAPLTAVALFGSALAIVDRAQSEVRRSTRWRAPALGLAASVALASSAGRCADGGDGSHALTHALSWLRDHTSAPGAFNHPAALQSWRVAAPPAMAGSIASWARRPTVAYQVDGHASTGVERLLEALRSPDVPALSAALARLDCAYLVALPRMLADSSLALPSEGAVAQLLRLPPAEVAPFFERVYESSRSEELGGPTNSTGAGPAVVVFRRLSARANPTGSSMSPVR